MKSTTSALVLYLTLILSVLFANAADAPTIPPLTADEAKQCDLFMALNTDYQNGIIEAQAKLKGLQSLQSDLRTRVIEFNATTLDAHKLPKDKYFVDIAAKDFKAVAPQAPDKK